MKRNAWVILVGTVACIVCIASAAQADDQVARVEPERNGYGYVFKDDPLNAGLYDANSMRISVRKQPSRQLLIRPRWQFIAEMLKSVENL
jgi:hypothetical protein